MPSKQAPRKSGTKAAKAPALLSDFVPLRISGADFAAWQDGNGFSNREAARRIGAHYMSIPTFRTEGASQTVALACAAVSAGLEPYSKANAGTAERVRGYLKRTRKAG